MTQLIQAIANFSDGTRPEIVAGLKKIAENAGCFYEASFILPNGDKVTD